jgi:hypothetical protein
LAAGIAMVIGSLLKPTTGRSETEDSPKVMGGVS